MRKSVERDTATQIDDLYCTYHRNLYIRDINADRLTAHYSLVGVPKDCQREKKKKERELESEKE